jgi:effector-binding domain-containing protein
METAVQVREVHARPALVVHASCALKNIASTIGPMFGEVAAWAGAHGLQLSGPAVARYTDMARGEVEFDAGFLVDRAPATQEGRVRATDLGHCTAACATHLGPYTTLAETYAAIQRWIEDHGYVTAGPMWEEYQSPPGTPPEQTRTDVYWPIQRML